MAINVHKKYQCDVFLINKLTFQAGRDSFHTRQFMSEKIAFHYVNSLLN